MELGTAIARAGTSRVIDLGPDSYEVHGRVTIPAGKTVTGTGIIRHYPTDERDCECIRIVGADVNLVGTETVRGPMPDGHPYSANREAQHGIWLGSAVDPFIGAWKITNVYGDGVYAGKRDTGMPWTTGLVMKGTVTDEIGRCAHAMQAVDGATLSELELGRCNMSVMDAEPNGDGWGCKNLTWTDSVVRDHGGGFVFASLGQGKDNAVSNVRLDGIYCPNRVFNCNIRPPEGVRRSNFAIVNCRGNEFSNTPAIKVTRVDGVTVKHVNQPCRDDHLVVLTDCTHWDVPGSVSPNPPPPF